MKEFYNLLSELLSKNHFILCSAALEEISNNAWYHLEFYQIFVAKKLYLLFCKLNLSETQHWTQNEEKKLINIDWFWSIP